MGGGDGGPLLAWWPQAGAHTLCSHSMASMRSVNVGQMTTNSRWLVARRGSARPPPASFVKIWNTLRLNQ